MRVSAAHLRHWQQRLARERQACADRLRRALPAADRCAAALKRRWPGLGGVWLFGSAVDGSFGIESDIDLAVEGLPPLDLLDAMAEAEAAVRAANDAISDATTIATPDATDNTTEDPMAVDLVRLESLPPHWQRRIRDRGRRLL